MTNLTAGRMFEKRFRYFLILLREFEVMDMVDIEKHLGIKGMTLTVFLRASRVKLDEIKVYRAKYKNDRGVDKVKHIYYMGDMTPQKLMLIGKKYTTE